MRILRHSAALCAIAALLFAAMSLLEFFYFRSLTGGIAGLDMRVAGFTPEQAMEWLTALGAPGREAVLFWHYLTLDLVLPAVIALALASLVLAAGKRLPGFARLGETAQTAFAMALVLPYLLADYSQNFLVARMLADPLTARPASMALASGLVVAKFVFGAIAVIILVAMFLAGQKNR